MSAELSETADSVPDQPVSDGNSRYFRTSGYTGSRAEKPADLLRKPTF
jgi:hypothetical protein